MMGSYVYIKPLALVFKESPQDHILTLLGVRLC